MTEHLPHASLQANGRRLVGLPHAIRTSMLGSVPTADSSGISYRGQQTGQTASPTKPGLSSSSKITAALGHPRSFQPMLAWPSHKSKRTWAELIIENHGGGPRVGYCRHDFLHLAAADVGAGVDLQKMECQQHSECTACSSCQCRCEAAPACSREPQHCGLPARIPAATAGKTCRPAHLIQQLVGAHHLQPRSICSHPIANRIPLTSSSSW